MSDTSLDNDATNPVAENPVAPPGDTPASTPASVDPTVSPEPDPDEAKKAEQDQDRKASRAFASQRRTITQLQRTIGRLEERLSGTPQQPQAKSGPPKQSDFNNFDDYMAAVVEHAGNTAIEKFKGESGNSDRQRAVQQTGQSFWKEAAKEAKEKGIEGFEEAAKAIRDEEVPTSPAMSHFIIEDAENKAAMVAWLAENPDEAERIAGLGPVQAGAALARVDAQLGKRPASVSKAPAPVPQPTGGGTAPQTIARMSYEDLKKQVAKWGRS